jgi:NTE family protein
LVNRAGTCDTPVPGWVTEGLKEKETNSRRYRAALTQRALLNSEDHPYIHLLDGGLTDNLGLRAILDRIVINGGIWDTLQEYGHQDAKQVVLIVVDASAIPPTQWDKSADGPPTTAILDAATTAPIASYNFETLQHVHRNIATWQAEIARARCRSPGRCAGTKFYLVDLSLESLADEELRDRLIAIPTRFRLEPEQVEDLIRAGGALLRSHAQFRRLILDRRWAMQQS